MIIHRYPISISIMIKLLLVLVLFSTVSVRADASSQDAIADDEFVSRAIQLQKEKVKINPYSHDIVSPFNVGNSQKSSIDHVNLWVYFTDKKKTTANSTTTINLNQQSLSRRSSRSEHAVGALKNIYQNSNSKSSADYVIDSFDVPINQIYIDRVVAVDSSLISVRHRSNWLNAVSITVRLDNNLSTLDEKEAELSKLVKRIKTLPNVLKVIEVSQIKSTSSEQKPLTASKSLINEDLVNLVNGVDYAQSFKQLSQINIIDAHTNGYTGKGVTILILDTGFYKDHESLKNCKIVGEHNFIDNTSETQGPLGDPQNSHGTYILSNLAAYQPGKMIGAAYNANYLLAKTEIVSKEIPVEEDYFISALEWGESQGVDVVTASLGYNEWYKYWDLTGDSAISKAVDIATGKGVVVY
ncbi:hypothetical protein PPL_00103 [Heterostelium album PN500]|uniref:Peptidase S8/S53 domain-containing protein n=1 Tax=Heterostelium pallidum (strain ATCC 26659 / Pp 5 / PN500) TaxID=670386 RepID=D3AVJ0_HETP5|nr:hypothetical protein PPL_00103 [Heterostelium album PN500]EFA86313.1 hypothetical protein PPL_00103 [Heterostelium album PN500]|eukprot:XP_020438418.1 hypothetical protein PPL_00103 [Heterostelium album PN500]